MVPVGGVFVAVVVRLIATPTDRKILLSSPPPSLPPALLLYGRDEFIQDAVGKILQRSEVKKHVAIRAGPGMGKTAAATGIMHHPRIVQHFGNARHWVDCHEASDILDDLKAQKLLDFITHSLDLDLTALSDSRKNIKYFLDNNDVPRIIVLDNFETVWEPPSAQKETEGVLTFLARFPRLTIIITTRNAHDPATHRGVLWHQFESIQPLSLNASRMLFTSLSPSKSIDSRLDALLRAVNYIPLPIVLMASSAQEHYTTSMILEIWNRGLSKHNINESQPNYDDSDPLNKLDHSVAISLNGPLIKSNPKAPELLRIIAGLPGGIGRKNLQRIVPLIDDVDRVAAVLIRTSLLMNSPDVLQMHSTIRYHMLRNYPLNASYKEGVEAFYFQLIHNARGNPGTQGFIEHIRNLSEEETNAETLLLDALEHNFSTSVSISLDYSNYLTWNVPRLDVPKKTLELVRTYQQLRDADSWLPLALLRLGTVYFRLNDFPKAIEALQEALGLYEKLNDLNWVAQAQFLLADIARLRGEHAVAFQLFSEAYKRFEDVDDARNMAACLRGTGITYFLVDRRPEALDTISTAQKTCSPEDYTCITDCERELGRIYRVDNQTESIRLSAKARDYYLVHGPQRHASIALYQKSVALYLQGYYNEAEVGLDDAFQEFKSSRNDGQMGYCVFHLAELNKMRGTYRNGLELYRRSETMFEHMQGNKFMVGLSLRGQAELYAKLCQPDKARQVYNSAHTLMKELDVIDEATVANDIQNIDVICDPAIWRRNVIFKHLPLFLACMVICLLLVRRQWRYPKKKQLQDRSLELGQQG
ncbi:uncharacterized protein LACBIDRAFT_315761 [Laccaria bicolor S238N-H82]|uniref:Predicted protein n=1 Tax=Laccaria bicolor (strain S238N-H82 / ATCC MYA-4686) TaxID=486041 RepID=B0D340_LACBS|nr:uncharacterized protein LACBIDRAFT_315761 [Laccaria bicolor S238N-H82]EDR11212.1 predicted protein [Laccaria bicolor S238N-H82]|eukprot:XP_001878513.1 predicted protein [Laccaria bicolor S238N-H82]